MKMDVHISFSILSENQTNDRYTDLSSVGSFQRCERALSGEVVLRTNTHSQFVSGGGRSPMVVRVSVDQ